jgi:hypothetical protein
MMHGLCAVCLKPDRGFGWKPKDGKAQRWFCSMKHLNLWVERKMDWSKSEESMLLDAGKHGGEYLQSIGETDLARLSKVEWLMFLKCVIGRMAILRAAATNELNDDIPF